MIADKLFKQSRAEQSRAEQSRAERIEWIDIAKGIAILCVILGHLGVDNINRIVFTFHMPLFFIISGMFIPEKMSYCLYVKKKVRTLLIPYATTCILTCALSLVLSLYFHKPLLKTLWKWFCGSLYGAGFNAHGIISHMPVFIGALWFLWALFWGLLIVRRIIDKTNEKYQFYAICIIAWIGYQTAQTIWLPLDIQAGMTASIFIYYGYIARQYKLYERQSGKFLMLLSIFVLAWCIKYFKGFWMVNNFFGNGFMDIFGALAAFYLISLLSKKLLKCTAVSAILRWYGTNSIVILCFHIIELNLIPWNMIVQASDNQLIWIILCKFIWASGGAYIVNKFNNLRFLFKGEKVNNI